MQCDPCGMHCSKQVPGSNVLTMHLDPKILKFCPTSLARPSFRVGGISVRCKLVIQFQIAVERFESDHDFGVWRIFFRSFPGGCENLFLSLEFLMSDFNAIW